MPRIAWIVLSAAAALLFLGFAGAAFVIAASSGSEDSELENTFTLIGDDGGPVVLPLADHEETLMLAQRKGRVLVGMAANPDGTVEVAALAGETPVLSDDLTFAVDGLPVEAVSCGRACSRLHADAFNGARRITVDAPQRFEFLLPKALPAPGAGLFSKVQQEMGSLRTHRYTEELTSGVGAARSVFEVRAPNRLAFRTAGGFRSIIIGRNRWDFRSGRWERSTFPGLRVPTYMWDGARNARLLGKTRFRGRPVQILSVYDREPVPAWFRLLVDAQNRVVDAHMIAPSHFMNQRFSDFNGPIVIRPPA